MSRKTFIPKSTQIFGRELKVEHKETKVSGLYGEINLRTGIVTLAKNTKEYPISPDELEVTYLHEITHFILNKTGFEEKLVKAGIDLEDIVETFAMGMYDALKNSK